MNKKYLHLISDTLFTMPFIEFINTYFDKNEHLFIIRHNNQYRYSAQNIYLIKAKKNKLYKLCAYFRLLILMITYKKIVLHGVFDTFLVVFLFINRYLLKKCNWCIWGGDLYCYQKREQQPVSISRIIYYKIENYVKGSMGGYITSDGDYKLAQKWFNVKGTLYNCIGYPSNLYKEIKMAPEIEKNVMYIQVGNSIDPSNNHIEILEKLKKFKDANILIYCVLAYGNYPDVKKRVIDYGKELFGEKFIPIVDIMPTEDYLDFLSNIDIAIFAHNRQQAMGNTISLLGMGKTVYIRQAVTPFELFQKLGIKILPFEELADLNLISEQEKNNNITIIKNRFSKEQLIKDWSEIFKI
jgi:hypothetical protein